MLGMALLSCFSLPLCYDADLTLAYPCREVSADAAKPSAPNRAKRVLSSGLLPLAPMNISGVREATILAYHMIKLFLSNDPLNEALEFTLVIRLQHFQGSRAPGRFPTITHEQPQLHK